jgi:enoyl reductase-like protein
MGKTCFHGRLQKQFPKAEVVLLNLQDVIFFAHSCWPTRPPLFFTPGQDQKTGYFNYFAPLINRIA